MTDKEKQAIEILKNDEMYITDSFYREFRTTIADKYTKAFEKVLNLIENKDKIIDEMAKYIGELDIDEDICRDKDCDEYTNIYTGEIDCKTCIKEYFKKKVEDD